MIGGILQSKIIVPYPPHHNWQDLIEKSNHYSTWTLETNISCGALAIWEAKGGPFLIFFHLTRVNKNQPNRFYGKYWQIVNLSIQTIAQDYMREFRKPTYSAAWNVCALSQYCCPLSWVKLGTYRENKKHASVFKILRTSVYLKRNKLSLVKRAVSKHQVKARSFSMWLNTTQRNACNYLHMSEETNEQKHERKNWN